MTPAALVRLFVRHRNAANLLMALTVVVGVIAITRLNTQFFPTLGFDIITVSVAWPGAAAEDVESGIVQVIEPEIRFLDGVRRVSATANEGGGTVTIEFDDGTDMQAALSEVESAVGRLTTLPVDSEEPQIGRVQPYETVARLALTGPFDEGALQTIARGVRDELLSRGIDRITMFGVRDQEVLIEIDEATLRRLDLTVADVAGTVRDTSQDTPLGRVDGDVERQLRTVGQRDRAADFADIEVRAFESGERVLLGDVARLTDGFDRDQAVGRLDGHPAVELVIERATTADALEASAIVRDYLHEREGTWPAGLEVEIYDIFADLIDDRIRLLIENGLTGLAVVLIVLFLFLQARVAIWIAAGIPVALAATGVVMLATGQSINMLSLFGVIMALGIIVDDAIVVGEHAAHQYGRGRAPIDAAENGALRMLAPVVAATLTTIATFLPIFLIGGIIGQIVAAIPLVVIAVLIASLVECFLILPTHMRDALAAGHGNESRFRRWFDQRFDALRHGVFRRMVNVCVRWRYLTLASAVAVLALCVGLIAGGRVGFVFFSSPESDTVLADIAFAPGTPSDRSEAMIAELVRSARATEEALTGQEGSLIAVSFGRIGSGQSGHVATLHVELMPSDMREVRTQAFIDAWREQVSPLAGLEVMVIRERAAGPPGRDVDIRLSGGTPDTLKAAALDVRALLARFDGVTDIEDDLPYGRPETVLELTPRGRALGFTTDDVARQVRDSFEGAIADRFARGDQEITIRVSLRRDGRTLDGLRALTLRGPSGAEVPLTDVVRFREDQGFSVINREDGVREVAVTAEVDEAVNDPGALLAILDGPELAAIAETHGVATRFDGRAEEEAETFADIRLGAIVGLVSIYVILAWVFASYGRPLVVMTIIPFGVIGAVIGHLALGYDMTVMSLVALLGLSGILVNDSIILVGTIDRHIAEGKEALRAAVDGTCERLRAVLLTSLTTIGGITPLLFETSYQAQFLVPMTITLVFGLMITTVLVLFVVPALFGIQEDLRRLVKGGRGQRPATIPRTQPVA